ncbi:hypothetical protein RUND412_004515 [Rhizina undulata]
MSGSVSDSRSARGSSSSNGLSNGEGIKNDGLDPQHIRMFVPTKVSLRMHEAQADWEHAGFALNQVRTAVRAARHALEWRQASGQASPSQIEVLRQSLQLLTTRMERYQEEYNRRENSYFSAEGEVRAYIDRALKALD